MTSVFDVRLLRKRQQLFEGIKISNPDWLNVTSAPRQDQDLPPSDIMAGSTVRQVTLTL